MKLDSLALYTTVYPGVEPYIGAWHRSVLTQTDRSFDIWIGVDCLSREQIIAAIGEEPHAQWVEAARGDSPAQVRQRAIEVMIEQYDAVVFVDSDDLLRPSRVAAARLALRKHELVACAMDLIDEAGNTSGAVLAPPKGTDPANMLPRYNVFGLSNTIYKSALLKRCLPAPANCVLIDWLLATRAWALGASLSFDRTPRMAYRQYAANIAPVTGPFTSESILSSAQLVLNHYRCLLDSGDVSHAMAEPYRSRVEEARERAEVFYGAITRFPQLLSEYTTALSKMPVQHIWWWSVAHPDLEATWRS
jgi:hypothetical protein